MGRGVVTSVGVTQSTGGQGQLFLAHALASPCLVRHDSRPSDRRYFSNMSVKPGQIHFGEPECVFALHLHVFPAAPLFSL